MERFDHVIVGAGPAGGAAALELCQHAPGSVLLIGEEPHLPYERPPLSKAVLAAMADGGERPVQGLFGAASDFQARGVHWWSHARATALDAAGHRLSLSDGREVTYGKLLLATGARARRLALAHADRPNVCYLRTHEDAQRLGSHLRAGARVVVIGGGFIGLEVAATAVKLGCRVTVIEANSRLMARALPPELSTRFQEKFAAHGVDLLLGVGVAALEGEDLVKHVRLSTGDALAANAVVVGIGSVPNAELAAGAGLAVNDGIVVDEQGQTSDPDIYAVGDVVRRSQALQTHPSYAVRLEAWEPALDQAIQAARAMAGKPVAATKVPWMWSDQFDWNLQAAGYGDIADEVVLRTGTSSDCLTAFQLFQGRLVGVVTLNNAKEMMAVRRVLGRQPPVDRARLRDTALSIRDALSA